jgi:glycosyltransferase involved in cell wall biosynthesis
MRSKDPSFSVVIPLYNKAGQITATLNSIVSQTLTPHEVIVVDDGSTDGSGERVAAHPGPGISLICQPNAGEGAARNAGAAAATGDWIAFIDADDLWRSEHLATLAEVIQAYPSADLVGTASLAADVSSSESAAASPAPSGSIKRLDFFGQHDGSVFFSSSVAIRRSAFEATSGFGRWSIGTDTEFWIRFALEHEIAVSTRQTSIYVRGNGGAMEQAAKDAASGRRTARSHAPVFELLEQALATSRYGDLHEAIRGYADRTRLTYARGRLYAGRGNEARELLKGMVGPPNLQTQFYHLLSYAPGTILRGGARCYSALKRRL